MKKTPIIIVSAVVVVGALLAIIVAAGGKDSSSSMDDMDGMSTSEMSSGTNEMSKAAPADAVATDKVTIEDYKFGPENIKVKVGTTVTWTNNDSVRHNVAGEDESMLPVGKLIGKGESYSYTFTKAGVYEYYCSPHTYMKATVTVE